MKGGVPAATSRLISGLREAGHEPALLADAPLRGLDGAPFFRLDYPQNSHMRNQTRAALTAFRPEVCHVVSAGIRMIHVMEDVLHGFPWVLSIHSVPPAERKLCGFHASNRVHYFLRNERFRINALGWRRMLRRRAPSRIICHSRLVRITAERYGCHPAKLVEVPLGVDLPEGPLAGPSPLSSPGPKIVTVGGIGHTKGVHDFVRALARLIKDFPGTQYHVMGEVRDKSYLEFLEKLIARLGLMDNVSIFQSPGDEAKARALAEADLYVQPSHEEGFCLAYVEAASIVPRLLGTDTGAIGAVSAGLPASRVVTPANPAALERAARELLAAPVPPDVFIRRQEFLRRNYSQTVYTQAHVAVYRQLAGLDLAVSGVLARYSPVAA
jgi:glycosyltransferase involved in cell wall biosynthesis